MCRTKAVVKQQRHNRDHGQKLHPHHVLGFKSNPGYCRQKPSPVVLVFTAYGAVESASSHQTSAKSHRVFLNLRATQCLLQCLRAEATRGDK